MNNVSDVLAGRFREYHFFQQVHKKLLKSRNDCLLIYRLLHYFPMLSKNSIR